MCGEDVRGWGTARVLMVLLLVGAGSAGRVRAWSEPQVVDAGTSLRGHPGAAVAAKGTEAAAMRMESDTASPGGTGGGGGEGGCRPAPVALCITGQIRSMFLPRNLTVGVHGCMRPDAMNIVGAVHENVIRPFGGTGRVNVFADVGSEEVSQFSAKGTGQSLEQAFEHAWRPRRFALTEHTQEQKQKKMCGNGKYIQFARWKGCADLIRSYEAECGFQHETIIHTRPDFWVPPMCRFEMEPDTVYGRPQHHDQFSDTMSFGLRAPMLRRLDALDHIDCKKKALWPVDQLNLYLKSAAANLKTVTMLYYLKAYIVRAPHAAKAIAGQYHAKKLWHNSCEEQHRLIRESGATCNSTDILKLHTETPSLSSSSSSSASASVS